MRIIVILTPTNVYGTKTEYSNLRNFLLSDGYLRTAPEVYERIVENRKGARKHLNKLNQVAPKTGIVRILKLTEKQYEKITYLTGSKSNQEKIVGNNCNIII